MELSAPIPQPHSLSGLRSRRPYGSLGDGARAASRLYRHTVSQMLPPVGIAGGPVRQCCPHGEFPGSLFWTERRPKHECRRSRRCAGVRHAKSPTLAASRWSRRELRSESSTALRIAVFPIRLSRFVVEGEGAPFAREQKRKFAFAIWPRTSPKLLTCGVGLNA
jgi:hypothetical protein